MPYYLLQAAYSRDAWAKMKATKDDGICAYAIKPVVERHGGKYHNGWLAFGEYDSVVIMEMPDNKAAAAVSMELTLQGTVKDVKTTPLVPTEVGKQALHSIS
jgi:uncharacterized protein with GYD domain